ncbi:MAG TPA: hypothetical protein CFH82_10285 [Sulfurospirillum sp. UBA12182]|nr:MAG TPA: hypothetical protein CFH82_10285 [Sulfurospirillum sp. UBA12182]
MKKMLSLAAVACLMITGAMAEDLSEAFKNGKVSGDVVLHAERQNNNGTTLDAGFTNGSLGLSYETGEYKSFKASVGFRANSDFSEEEDGDFGGDETKALLHTANISYSSEFIDVIVGRQEIDLEWMGDFHEAYVAVVKPVANLAFVLGYSDKYAVADADAELEKFTKIGTDGAYVLDVKYSGIEGLGLNAYYYSANDIADWYGAKVDYDTDMFGATAHYASSNVDALVAPEDGSILHVEARGNFADFGLKAGYISTDKDTGVDGIMNNVGDNISPFEDGNQVYVADSDTYYFGASYAIAGVELGAIYGESKYGTTNAKEKEFNFTADYGVTDELSLGLLFVDVSAEDSNDDYNRIGFTATYAF